MFNNNNRKSHLSSNVICLFLHHGILAQKIEIAQQPFYSEKRMATEENDHRWGERLKISVGEISKMKNGHQWRVWLSKEVLRSLILGPPIFYENNRQGERKGGGRNQKGEYFYNGGRTSGRHNKRQISVTGRHLWRRFTNVTHKDLVMAFLPISRKRKQTYRTVKKKGGRKKSRARATCSFSFVCGYFLELSSALFPEFC